MLAGVYFDTSAEIPTWKLRRTNKTFHINDKMRRDPASLDEETAPFEPCMEVKLDKGEDFFWYQTVDCENSTGKNTAAMCYERECFKSFEDLLRYFLPRDSFIAYTGIDMAKNPWLNQFVQFAHEEMKSTFKVLFKRLLTAASKPSVLEFMWNTNLPCFHDELRRGKIHLLSKCSWKGTEVPCQRIFKRMPTDYGMCCTFNAAEAELTYKESKYMDTVRFLRNAEVQPGDNDMVDLTTQSGRDKGLTLFLDSRGDALIEGSVASDASGFTAYVSPNSEYPWVKKKGFAIEPGKETFVRLQATRVRGNKDDIGHIDPGDRNCLFPDESPLHIHRHYSLASCIYECSVDVTLAALRDESNVSACMPWYFVQTDDRVRFCDPWEAQAFEEILGNVLPHSDCAHCLPDCETTTYTATQSASAFRFAQLWSVEGPLCHVTLSSTCRSCDGRSLGMTDLCSFDTTLEPVRWSDKAYKLYDPHSRPDYIEKIELGHRCLCKKNVLAVLRRQIVLFFSSRHQEL